MRTNISYPYPVIGNTDDVEGRFVPKDFRRSSDPDTVTLDYEFEVTNPTLLELLKNGQAIITIQVKCSSTFYSHAFEVNDMKNAIKIPSSKLREKVNIYFYICAVSAISDYLPVGSHPDYTGFGFNIEKGDVLAIGGSTSFIAEKTFDPLNAPLSSLFRIQFDTHKGTTRLDLEQDKILITLPEEDFKLYFEATKRKLIDIVHATVVYPVLVEVLNAMNRSDVDYEQFAWYERINQICIHGAIDREDPLIAAQKILANPLGRSLKQLDDRFSASESDD